MENEDLPFNLITFKGYEKELVDFLDSNYASYPIIPHTFKNLKLPPFKERICQFCGRRYPEVKFKNTAHIVPEFLGRNSLYSFRECHECNVKFGKFDDSFKNYLGMIPTVFGISGKEGIPNFKGSSQITAKVGKFNTVPDAITINAPMKGFIQADTKTGETTFNYQSNRYVPVLAYKSLVHMALSFIPTQDISMYSVITQLLQKDKDCHDFPFAKVLVSYSPYEAKTHCYLFTSKNTEGTPIKHIFQLYFNNFMFQIFLPTDQFISNCKPDMEYTIRFCPPIYLNDMGPANGKFGIRIEDWSSRLPIKRDLNISFKMEENWSEKASIFNPLRNIDMNDIKVDPEMFTGFIIVKRSIDDGA